MMLSVKTLGILINQISGMKRNVKGQPRAKTKKRNVKKRKLKINVKKLVEDAVLGTL